MQFDAERVCIDRPLWLGLSGKTVFSAPLLSGEETGWDVENCSEIGTLNDQSIRELWDNASGSM